MYIVDADGEFNRRGYEVIKAPLQQPIFDRAVRWVFGRTRFAHKLERAIDEGLEFVSPSRDYLGKVGLRSFMFGGILGGLFLPMTWESYAHWGDFPAWFYGEFLAVICVLTVLYLSIDRARYFSAYSEYSYRLSVLNDSVYPHISRAALLHIINNYDSEAISKLRDNFSSHQKTRSPEGDAASMMEFYEFLDAGRYHRDVDDVESAYDIAAFGKSVSLDSAAAERRRRRNRTRNQKRRGK
jgi:hypothetical protein